MIKRINKYLTVVIVLCLVAVCCIYYQYKSNPNKDRLIVGTTYMTMNNTFYTALNNEIEKVINENNDILYTRDPVLDSDKQNEQIRDLVDLGINVLIVNPVSYSKIDDSLKYAKDNGVKIIVVDAPVQNDSLVDCTIVSNNYDAGVQCANNMMSQLPTARIILLEHEEALSAVERIRGFEDTIKDNDNYQVVDRQNCLGQTELTLPLMMESIKRNNDFNVVFALNDPSALGALAAIKEANVSQHVYVYGVDGSPDAKKILNNSNEIQGTASQSPIMMGQKAIEIAYKIKNNESYDASIVVPVTLITKENVNDYDVSGWQ